MKIWKKRKNTPVSSHKSEKKKKEGKYVYQPLNFESA